MGIIPLHPSLLKPGMCGGLQPHSPLLQGTKVEIDLCDLKVWWYAFSPDAWEAEAD